MEDAEGACSENTASQVFIQSLHVYVFFFFLTRISQAHHFLIPYLLLVLPVQLHLEDQGLPAEIMQKEKNKIIGIKGQLYLSLLDIIITLFCT